MRRCLPIFIFLLLVLHSPVRGREITAGSVPAQSVTAQIDRLIRAQWTDYKIQPSAEATDGEWLRRVFLDVIGRIPTQTEYSRFTSKRGASKRAELIESLLYGEEYAVEFAAHWATIWGNLLVGRGTGRERNSLINRDGLQKYLRDSFASNRSYDRIVHDLIVATGNNKPGLENFNGAVNFLSMKLGDSATQATADVSRLFLGKQVQCTQCHDHPFNDWKQNQFWELNSFFRQAVPLRRFDATDDSVSHVELADQDFGGEGDTPEEAEVYFQIRDATLATAYPVFIDGTELANKSGFVRDVNRRQELAQLIVESDELPRALVNRMWAHFFNHGFTTPVDDMGPHNPPSHPDLLEYLAEQFQQHSFDMRALMRWITTTEAYSLSSRVTKSNSSDDPWKGETPRFSHYYLRQLRAEELFDSLITATGADHLEDRSNYDQTRRKWLNQFVVAFGNDEGTEGSTFDGTITQSLVLFNGELVQESLSIKPDSWLYRIAMARQGLEPKVNRLYVAGLSRNARKNEHQAARQILQWRNGNVAETLQDIWWAILNSNEFILNH